MDNRGRIVIQEEIRAGKPVVNGTRITLYGASDYLAGGASESELGFHKLSRDDIIACRAFAADRERRVASSLRTLFKSE